MTDEPDPEWDAHEAGGYADGIFDQIAGHIATKLNLSYDEAKGDWPPEVRFQAEKAVRYGRGEAPAFEERSEGDTVLAELLSQHFEAMKEYFQLAS